MNYIKTTIIKADYNKIQPFGGKYVVHLLPEDNNDGTVTCFECMTDHEPTEAEYARLEADAIAQYLPLVKSAKIAEIDRYDTSDAVNGFTYNGQTMWIDKATRVGLVNAVDSAIMLGKEDITFGISGVSVTLPCTTAKAMLAQLELYALDCYNVTLAHKTAVENMDSIADVDAYDVSVGYPPKLEF